MRFKSFITNDGTLIAYRKGHILIIDKGRSITGVESHFDDTNDAIRHLTDKYSNWCYGGYTSVVPCSNDLIKPFIKDNPTNKYIVEFTNL